jgi:hypothetical protein
MKRVDLFFVQNNNDLIQGTLLLKNKPPTFQIDDGEVVTIISGGIF